MSVVGFDFGSAKCVVAVVRNKGIDVLQNEVGHRSTPSLVAFSGNQRFLGSEAAAQLMSNPKNTISNMKALIGRRFNNETLAAQQKECTYTLTLDVSNNNHALITVNYDGKQENFTPEQVTGALFSKLKTIVENSQDRMKVSDCVIACSAWWNDEQRRSLLDAANVAGLNVLRLMNDTTAIGLNYGILRPLPEQTERKVLFYDLGYAELNCMVASFTSKKMAVLGTSSDHSMGSRNFDELLQNHFINFIKDKYKMDVSKDIKAMGKLRKECERVKLNLSANTKVPFGVEYIMNDRDVSGIIDRTEFENLAKVEILPRLINPVESLLAKLNIKKEELFSLEIVGGGSRIPMVQKCLTEFLGRDLSKTCDGDESVARGCALMCAMISPSVVVREFEVQDISPYAITLEWGPVTSDFSMVPEDSTNLFTANNPIPSVKLISFNDRTEPFQLVARYTNVEELPSGTNPILGKFIISGMQPKQEGKKIPKIKVRVKLNLHGILTVTSAQSVEEIIEIIPATTTPNTTNNNTTAATDATMSDSTPNPNEPKSPENPTSPSDTNEKKDESKMDTTVEPKTTTKIRKEELKVESLFTGGIDSKTLSAWFEREAAMNNQDRVIFQTNEARNNLEGYILEMRNSLSGSLNEFANEEDKQKFNTLLDDTESWLWDEGREVSKSTYVNKLNELKAIGDPIARRFYEYENREHAVSKLKQSIAHANNWANNKEEKYSHIEDEERNKILSESNNIDQWIINSLIQLDKQSKTDNPTITIQQIQQKQAELEKFTTNIMNKPKPKPKKEEKKEEQKPTENKEQTENTNTNSTSDNNSTNNTTEPTKDSPNMDTTQ